MPTRVLEQTLRRDRTVVIAGLMAVAATAWIYILSGAGMQFSSGMMAMNTVWSPEYFLLMLVMWWVMMVAMMLPAAAPMILLFATVNRKNRERGHAAVPTGVFAASYVVTWGVFSLLATLLQWGLEEASLLSPMMESASIPFGAALLIAAGVYQMTPLKYACLRHCRSPLHFLAGKWRSGNWGAIRMGLGHGTFCLGCCWVLMGLLFYGGVMNLAWIAGLTLYVLVEKIAPYGHFISRFGGLLLIGWGGALLLA
jgi:predicted metal-binding membrane protein